MTPLDGKLDPDRPRGRGKSISEDLDINEECSEYIDHNLTITTSRLH